MVKRVITCGVCRMVHLVDDCPRKPAPLPVAVVVKCHWDWVDTVVLLLACVAIVAILCVLAGTARARNCRDERLGGVTIGVKCGNR